MSLCTLLQNFYQPPTRFKEQSAGRQCKHADGMDKPLISKSNLLNKFHIFLYDLHRTHDEPSVD